MKKARLITCDGETHTMMEWSKISGTAYDTIKYRLKKGWEPHKAIFQKTQHPVIRDYKACNKDCDHCVYTDCIAPPYVCIDLVKRENGGDGLSGKQKDEEVPGGWMKQGKMLWRGTT